ncbi:adhesion G-protein coupled receptor G6-like [Glandiceps talaboti]
MKNRQNDTINIDSAVCDSPEHLKSRTFSDLTEYDFNSPCRHNISVANDTYLVVTCPERDWDTGGKYCSQLEDVDEAVNFSHLAIIEENDTRKHISTTLTYNPILRAMGSKGYWVGCNSSDGYFSWLNNHTVTGNNASWYNMPNKQADMNQCCILRLKQDDNSGIFKLDRLNCTERRPFICQLESNDTDLATNASQNDTAASMLTAPQRTKSALPNCGIENNNTSTNKSIASSDSTIKKEFTATQLTTLSRDTATHKPSTSYRGSFDDVISSMPARETLMRTSTTINNVENSNSTIKKEVTATQLTTLSRDTATHKPSTSYRGSFDDVISSMPARETLMRTSTTINNVENPDTSSDRGKTTTQWTTLSTTTPTQSLRNLERIKIPPEKVGHCAETLNDITSNAEQFEEDDLSQAVNVVWNILDGIEHGKQGGIMQADDVEDGTDEEVVRNLLQSVDNLFGVDTDVFVTGQKEHNVATRLIEAVERLSLDIRPENISATIETNNLAMTVADLNPATYRGLTFGFSDGETTFSVEDDMVVENEDVKSAIKLPPSLLDNVNGNLLTRIQFILYKTNSLFKAIDNSTPDGFSHVISASVGELEITKLTEPIEITLTHQKWKPLGTIRCVFWDVSLNDKNGGWSTEGCKVSSDSTKKPNMTVCECNHLTNFALLVDIYNNANDIDPTNQKALSIISLIGCAVSLLALAVTMATTIFCRKRKDKGTKILLNLCFALFMVLLLFLIGAIVMDYTTICMTTAVLLHYFLLAVMAWMALEATHMYLLLLVKVFETYISHFIIKLCVIGWGIPLLIVVVTLSVDVNNYGFHNGICWLSRYAFYGAFLTPFGLTLIFNTIIYCLVINQIYGLNSKALTADIRYSVTAQLRAAIGLMVLLGLTWMLAIFAIRDIASLVFQYLFAIFNSLQGLFIFIFHCALKKEVQNKWKEIFCKFRKDRYMAGRKRSFGMSTSKYHVSETVDTDLNIVSSTEEQPGQDCKRSGSFLSTFKPETEPTTTHECTINSD